jgi:hypothetical protein
MRYWLEDDPAPYWSSVCLNLTIENIVTLIGQPAGVSVSPEELANFIGPIINEVIVRINQLQPHLMIQNLNDD